MTPTSAALSSTALTQPPTVNPAQTFVETVYRETGGATPALRSLVRDYRVAVASGQIVVARKTED